MSEDLWAWGQSKNRLVYGTPGVTPPPPPSPRALVQVSVGLEAFVKQGQEKELGLWVSLLGS